MKHEILLPPAGYATWLVWLIETFGTRGWSAPPATAHEIRAAARRELDGLVRGLERAGGARIQATEQDADGVPGQDAEILVGLPGWAMEPLTITQLGLALGGLDDDVVAQLERERKIFSVRGSESRERAYPAFQAWPNIFGAPLASVLAVLEAAEEENIFYFFAAQDPYLATLTPVEMLFGRVRHPARKTLCPSDFELLARPEPERLAMVRAAARAYLAAIGA
jgi:hypothetical protein